MVPLCLCLLPHAIHVRSVATDHTQVPVYFRLISGVSVIVYILPYVWSYSVYVHVVCNVQ